MSRVLLTGGGGFIGGVVARHLRARGDAVVAVVQDPAQAGSLAALGVELVAGDLSSVDAIAAAMTGVDAVIHAAGRYAVGIPAAERPPMLDANEGTTKRVLEAAARVGVPRVVYVSTINVFGDTRGAVADETYRRDLSRGFISYYDESKYRAHQVAEAAIAAGQPIVIVQPSQVYGPGDHSTFGGQLAQAAAGTLSFRAFESMGVGVVHVDDLAAGILAALDRGRVGEAYVLSGPRARFGEALAAAARAGGKKLPRVVLPTVLLRVLAILPASVAVALGSPPNAREVLSASAGVTYFASSAKAERELGFRARSIEDGFREVFGPRA
ncbi:MAG: NAD-dependent epimerase/dehydratase family protein [Chloroflexota bacterium]